MNQEDKYIISEYNSLKTDKNLILEAERNNEFITLVGILQKADTLNRNGRIYPYDILKREAEKYMELIDQKCAFSECDHPSSSIVSLATTSHMVTDMWWEGKTLYGKIVLFDGTPSGGIAKDILKKGGTLGISSRGVGSVKTVNGRDVVQEDFELIAFDLVSSPSTPGAYMFKEGFERGKNGLTKIDTKEYNIIKESKAKSLLDNEFWKNI